MVAVSGAAPSSPWEAVSTLAGTATLPPPGAQPGRRGTLPDVPAAGLKGPVPAPCPHPGRGEAAPLKGAAPVRPHPPARGLALQGRAGRGAAGASKGTGKVSAGVPPSLPGLRYLTGVGSSQLPLKGTAPPFGSNDQLRASPKDVSSGAAGTPEGTILDGCTPRTLGERCRFCPSSSSPSLPFRELAGLGGGGEGVSVGLGESEPALPFGPVAGLALHPGIPGPK